MNLITSEGHTLMAKLCRNCALRVLASSCPASHMQPLHLQHSQGQPRRHYHHIRVETISEVWQKLKQEFKFLKKADANKLPRPMDFTHGHEIGVAMFLIRMSAKVHFSDGKWYGKLGDSSKVVWPNQEAVGYAVNAIDAREALLDRDGIKNIVKLKEVKFLNLEGCPYVDDACLASLVHLRGSLTHLSINRCPSVTADGIATLHKLRKLERLNMSDTPSVKYPKLIATLLEEAVPSLRVNIISHLAEKERLRKEGHVEQSHPQQQESTS